MITITIKGIPRETHRELKKRAAENRRSLNNEVIWVLESSLCGVPHAVRHIRQFEKNGQETCATEVSKKLKIVVMLGGPSAEREVSLRSGAGVVRALRSLGHSVFEIDPKTPDWILPPDTDVVCLAPLHGTYGEDGTVQRQLEKLGVIYTGCDAEASRIAFDKVLTKKLCIEAGVPTAKFLVVDSEKGRAPEKSAIAAGGQASAAGFECRAAIRRTRGRLAGRAGGGVKI